MSMKKWSIVGSACIAGMAATCDPAYVQSLDVKGNAAPLYSVKTEIPGLATGDQTLDLDLTLDQSGAIKDVTASLGKSICEIACDTFGTPPRTVCFKPIGCPGAGGGGGAMLEAPVIVEFLPKSTPGVPETTQKYDVTVRPLAEGQFDTPKTYELKIPKLAEQ